MAGLPLATTRLRQPAGRALELEEQKPAENPLGKLSVPDGFFGAEFLHHGSSY